MKKYIAPAVEVVELAVEQEILTVSAAPDTIIDYNDYEEDLDQL